MYNHRYIESKWIEKWTEQFVDYTTQSDSDKPKKYILVEFPFPSGAGLHVGHIRSYVAQDIKARMYRMQGYEVLYPMGWDAFGLPTEQYAIKHSIHPSVATQDNIEHFKKQLSVLGISFDWSREINTTDPSYYGWTQWIWLQMFKSGLAYQDTTEVWWCEELKTVLANEEVIDGKSERGGHPCERLPLTQWMLAITKYADRLDADLDTVDYLPVIKTQQRNWIGRSEGVELQFSIQDKDESIEVFTTRIDTLFGVTFLVLAPEHPLIERIVTPEYQDSVQAYQTQTKSKSDLERQQNTDKTGVFTGAYAIHPLTQALIPIWISDYVLMGYGTGAVMAVPAHDERDKEFAEIYQLLSIEVITADGYLCNSEIYNQLSSEEAKNIIITVLEEKGIGQRKIQYKLRDWVFSRQRYWGEPFPIIWIQEKDYQNITGDIQGYLPEKPITRKTSQHIEYAVPLHPDELPLELPPLNSYKPQGRGEGPLAQIQDWVQVWYHLSSGKTLPKTESRPDTTWVEGVRETDTMPNWAGSSWYYLRYIDPHNTKELASRDILEQWLPVDIYNGGMEHVTVHLLYSRFWHKFLYDIGVVPTIEPYQTRIAHGMILAEGGVKMSKSKGNTVDPMEMVDSFGADSLRLYEMFMGPYDESIAWDTRGLIGCNRFLKKLYQWVEDSVKNTTQTQSIDYYQLDYDTHSLIKKITEDIEKGKYNTCVSSCMEYLNTYSLYHFPLEYMRIYIQLLAPFAPHIAEELWEMIGETQTIHQSQWPIYDESKLVKSIISYQIHINGKMRGILDVKAEDSEDSIKAQALNTSFVQQYVPNIATAKVIINQTKNIIIIIA